MALLPFVMLPNIEQKWAVRILQAIEDVRGRDLVDLVLDLRQKLPVRRHYFQEYSAVFRVTATRRGYRSSVSARTRMILVVAVLAVVVGGAVAGITAATSDKPTGTAAAGPTVRSGA